MVYLILISDFGTRILGIRELAQRGTVQNDFIRGIWVLRISLSVGIILLWSLLLLIAPISSPRNWLMWLFGLAVIPMGFSTEWIFTGFERLGTVAISRILRNSIYITLIFFTVNTIKDVFWAPILFCFSHLISSSYLASIAIRWRILPSLSSNLNRLKEIFILSVPLGISAAMIQIYYFLDTILLGILRSPKELGYYSAAYKIILFLLAVSEAFGTALLPTFSRLVEKSGIQKIHEILPEIVNLLLWLGIAMTVGTFILAEDVIIFLFGESFLMGAPAMMILSGTLFAVFGNLPFGILLLAMKREKKYTVAVSCAAGTNLVLNLILIPLFGIIGAAVATVLSELCVWAIYRRYLRDVLISIPYLSIILKLILPNCLLAVTLIYLPGHVVMQAVTGSVVYLLSTRIAGIWSIQRIKYLTQMMKTVSN